MRRKESPSLYLAIPPEWWGKPSEVIRSRGRRGGKTAAANRAARNRHTIDWWLDEPEPVQAEQPGPIETTAEAIAALEAQFPWLRQALAPGRRATSANRGGAVGRFGLKYQPANRPKTWRRIPARVVEVQHAA